MCDSENSSVDWGVSLPDATSMATEEKRKIVAEYFKSPSPLVLPGVVSPPDSSFKNSSELLVSIKKHLKLVENPLKCADDMPEGNLVLHLGVIARDILKTLEVMSSKGVKEATYELAVLAGQAVDALSDENERNNEAIEKLLPKCSTWPGRVSPHKKIQQDLISPLLKKGFGENSIASKKRRPWESSANRLVLCMLEHGRSIAYNLCLLRDIGLLDDETAEVLPPIYGRLYKVGKTLTFENWKEWRDIGFMMLDEATNGENLAHKSFENSKLSGLVERRDRWRDAVEKAWEQLASDQ